MSTEFTLLSDAQMDFPIALRFWGGDENGTTVRFAFPKVLLTHMRKVHIGGDNGDVTSIGCLHSPQLSGRLPPHCLS